MEDLKIEVWGVFLLTRRQVLIFEMVFFIFFSALTVFLFSYDFKYHAGEDYYNFHAEYAKYASLTCIILIIIETQFLWQRITKAHLNLIQKQKQKIEQQNKNINDSLNYASRIQTALLPSNKKMNSVLNDHFIYYKPRDIVSGDFYWLNEINDKIIIAAADCTGHGVPGAFVSLLGISFLNEIVQGIVDDNKLIKPAVVLNELRNKIVSAISNKEEDDENYDGMDISICIIDRKSRTMCFAGALLPVYIAKIRKNENEDNKLIQLRGDIFPIGMSDFENYSYKNKRIELDEGDVFYMFSDGYADQFGGKKGRKFLTSNFKKLLANIAHFPLEEQKNKLHENINKWKGNNAQIDDIMVLGIKI